MNHGLLIVHESQLSLLGNKMKKLAKKQYSKHKEVMKMRLSLIGTQYSASQFFLKTSTVKPVCELHKITSSDFKLIERFLVHSFHRPLHKNYFYRFFIRLTQYALTIQIIISLNKYLSLFLYSVLIVKMLFCGKLRNRIFTHFPSVTS